MAGTNRCVPRPLEVKLRGIGEVRGVADKEANAVHTKVLFPSGSTLQHAVSVTM